MSNHYIGYGTLEGWAEVAREEGMETVYAVSGLFPKGKVEVIHVDELVVMCWFIDGWSVAHYCRLKVGQVELAGGMPFDEDVYGERRKRCNALYELVRDWLKGEGFRVREAMVGMPKDMILMNGSVGFVRWDKEGEVWVVEEAPAVAGEVVETVVCSCGAGDGTYSWHEHSESCELSIPF